MEAGVRKAHLYDAIVGVKRCAAVHASFRFWEGHDAAAPTG